MPELYGKPFKDELRTEIRQLRTDLWNERKEHRKTRDSLRMLRARSAELEARVQRMKELLQAAMADADRDIGPAVVERYIASFSRQVA